MTTRLSLDTNRLHEHRLQLQPPSAACLSTFNTQDAITNSTTAANHSFHLKQTQLCLAQVRERLKGAGRRFALLREMSHGQRGEQLQHAQIPCSNNFSDAW